MRWLDFIKRDNKKADVKDEDWRTLTRDSQNMRKTRDIHSWMCRVTCKDKYRNKYIRGTTSDAGFEKDHEEMIELVLACDEGRSTQTWESVENRYSRETEYRMTENKIERCMSPRLEKYWTETQ